jgi:hypothetical protein
MFTLALKAELFRSLLPRPVIHSIHPFIYLFSSHIRFLDIILNTRKGFINVYRTQTHEQVGH